MKKKFCKPCLAISTLFLALPFMVPGVSAASADAISNVMTGDQTNIGMIIGLSVAASIAGLVIIAAIIYAVIAKKKRNSKS